MFTDIEGYTTFVQQNESEAVKKIELHRKVLSEQTAHFNGQIIQFYGDGSLSIYHSAVDAVNCAVAMQRAYNTDQKVPVRIGIHLGDIIQREDGLFGEGVNIASRIQNLGVPGAVFISEKVRNEISNQVEMLTRYMGKYRLKNVREKVRIYALEVDGVITPKKRSSLLQKSWMKDLIYPLILALVLFGGSKVFNLKLGPDQFQSTVFSAADDQISIPLFKNLDAVDSLTYVGDQASHFITYGLSQVNSLNVTSYETTSNLLATEASLGNIASFGRLTGTSHILRGTYLTWPPGTDSIRFTVMLEDLRGNVEHAFDEVYGSKENIGEAISKLLSSVKGYLAAKDDKTFSIPNDEAYKAFLQAKNIWSSDYVQAESLLQRSISLDSNFIDAHFYLLSLYYNEARFREMIDHIEQLRRSSSNLSDRQRNMLSYYAADAQGNLRSAFEYFYKEYSYSPRDIFNNTGMMVVAQEYINNPQLVIEVLEEIDNDSLDYNACSYCRFRLYLGIMAYLNVGKKRAARKLANHMPYDIDRILFYEALLRIHTESKDTKEIVALIQRAKSQNLNRRADLLNYLAAINFLNDGEKTLSDEFFEKFLQSQIDSINIESAHALYFQGAYDRSIIILEQLLKENPEDPRLLSRMVMSQAMADMTQAGETMTKLEHLKPEVDFGKTTYYQAVGALHMGDVTKSIQLLEKSVAEGIKFNYHRFNNDPDLITIRNNRNYQNILDIDIDMD